MEKDSDLIKIQITIPKFIERAAGKVVIFYQNIIKMGKDVWEIEKRFSQYDDLNTMLKKKYANLPRMPTKGFFKLNPEGWEKRRLELQEYVRGLAKRTDIRTDPFFRDFFELDLHNANTICYSPVKVTELGGLPLGIRDFYYLNDKGLLFIALSDMKITSRLDSYLTNLSMPWDKKDKIAGGASDTYATVGALLFYRVGLRESNGEWVFTRLWAKNFSSQTNILAWSPEKQYMFLGMDNGRIYAFSMGDKEISLKLEAEIKAHSKRVMGIAYDPETTHIMSIAEDGKFKCSDVSGQEPVHEESLGRGGLKVMVHDKSHKRCFIGDGEGTVHIVSHVNYPPELISTIQSENKSCIRGMWLDDDAKFLFTGDTGGYINCFDLGPVGKERFAKQISEMTGVSKLRYLWWSNKNREIFAGNQTGKVTVFDPAKGQPIYVHEAHENAITKMQWFEKSRYLMTSSKEKALHIWEFPKTWIVEELPDGESKVEEEKVYEEKKVFQETKVPKEYKLTKENELDYFEEEREKTPPQPVDNKAAYENIDQGFDPLGAGKFKSTDMHNDDDLMGWHK